MRSRFFVFASETNMKKGRNTRGEGYGEGYPAAKLNQFDCAHKLLKLISVLVIPPTALLRQ